MSNEFLVSWKLFKHKNENIMNDIVAKVGQMFPALKNN